MGTHDRVDDANYLLECWHLSLHQRVAKQPSQTDKALKVHLSVKCIGLGCLLGIFNLVPLEVNKGNPHFINVKRTRVRCFSAKCDVRSYVRPTKQIGMQTARLKPFSCMSFDTMLPTCM